MASATTKILLCDKLCEHSFQDAKYGKNKRVYNKITKQDGKMYRCTVCLKEVCSL